MRLNKIITSLTWPVLALGVILIAPTRVLAHCDGLDGPVVKAAQRALDTRNPAFALIWVQAKDEPEIRWPTGSSSRHWCVCTAPAKAHPSRVSTRRTGPRAGNSGG